MRSCLIDVATQSCPSEVDEKRHAGLTGAMIVFFDAWTVGWMIGWMIGWEFCWWVLLLILLLGLVND